MSRTRLVSLAIVLVLLLPLSLLLTGTPMLAAGQSGQAGQGLQGQSAWDALQAGDADRAASLFHDAIAARPQDAMLHLGAGAAAYTLGRSRDAIDLLRRALELNPKLVDASVLLGEIEYRGGDVDAAVRTFEAALALSPSNRIVKSRLDAWRKEASLHRGLEQWNNSKFSVIFEGRSDAALATRAMKTLDDAYWRIGAEIGAYPPGHILVTLYSEEQFRDIVHGPAWSAGAFDGRIRVPVKNAAQNLRRFDEILTHELTHAMLHGLASQGMPAWLNEGLASYFEPRDPEKAVRLLKTARVAIPLSQLQEGFGRFDSRQALFAYSQSLVAADILIHRLTTNTALLVEYLGKGYSFDQSLRVIGIEPAEFDAALMRRIR